MDFNTALENFVDVVQKMINEHYRDQFSNLSPPTISVDIGKRYTKIISTRKCGQRSVYCFIDKNGDILKSATWKAPAKGVRGNIYESFVDAITIYGAKYIR
jgi:MoaA/NifB/PqqE/SkfB family radical SAM enzyme